MAGAGGTPPTIIKKVGNDVCAVLGLPAVQKQIAILGTYVQPMSQPQLVAFIESEQALWRPGVRQVEHTAH